MRNKPRAPQQQNMKTNTSLLLARIDRGKRRADALERQPVGVPTGVIYSHTRACDGNGVPSSDDTLVLVKLTGGPMVMGAMLTAAGERLEIGSRVRMVLDEGHVEVQPASHRNRFEKVNVQALAEAREMADVAAL